MSSTEITTEENGQYFLIRLPMVLDTVLKNKFEEKQEEWLQCQAPMFVIDMTYVQTFQKQAYAAFGQFAQGLKRTDKKLYSFGLNEKVLRQITLDGLEQVFNPHKTLNDILSKTGIKAASLVKLDSNFINPFITATTNILKTQAKLDVTVGKPRISSSETQTNNSGIAAVISLVSSNFNGTISLDFPNDVFLKIHRLMFGEKNDSTTDGLKNCAAELLNMIFGQAKMELNEKGHKLEKVLPTIITGENLKIYHDSSSKGLILPLHSPAGDFHLQVSLGS